MRSSFRTTRFKVLPTRGSPLKSNFCNPLHGWIHLILNVTSIDTFCVEAFQKKFCGQKYFKNYETYYRSARVQVLTISKYFLTISNNFLGLSHSILLYLGLSWSFLHSLGAYLCISVFLNLSWALLDSRTISDYL